MAETSRRWLPHRPPAPPLRPGARFHATGAESSRRVLVRRVAHGRTAAEERRSITFEWVRKVVELDAWGPSRELLRIDGWEAITEAGTDRSLAGRMVIVERRGAERVAHVVPEEGLTPLASLWLEDVLARLQHHVQLARTALGRRPRRERWIESEVAPLAQGYAGGMAADLGRSTARERLRGIRSDAGVEVTTLDVRASIATRSIPGEGANWCDGGLLLVELSCGRDAPPAPWRSRLRATRTLEGRGRGRTPAGGVVRLEFSWAWSWNLVETVV